MCPAEGLRARLCATIWQRELRLQYLTRELRGKVRRTPQRIFPARKNLRKLLGCCLCHLLQRSLAIHLLQQPPIRLPLLRKRRHKIRSPPPQSLRGKVRPLKRGLLEVSAGTVRIAANLRLPPPNIIIAHEICLQAYSNHLSLLYCNGLQPWQEHLSIDRFPRAWTRGISDAVEQLRLKPEA